MNRSPEPGQSIGRYRLTRELGRGAMGQVFLAEDTVLAQPVCLKLLHPQYLHQPEAVARFTRELVLARRIAHPGVCRLYDLHEDGGQRFITMEFIEGAPLKSLVGRGASVVGVGRALRLVRNLCLGLAAAHEKGVVHRDLKPGNIMVRAGTDDDVCILDFGIAAADDTAAQGLTRPGVALGTRLYIAPEVWAGQPATARSDLFAVGVILFRLLTGEMPWAGGEDDLDVLDRMLRQPSRRVSSLRPEVGPVVDAILARALAVEPAARIPDAHAFVAALDDALAALPAARPDYDAPTHVERAAHVVVDDAPSSSASTGGTRWRSVSAAVSSPPRPSPAEGTRSITDPVPDDEPTHEAFSEPPTTSGEESWVVAGRPVGSPVKPKVMAVPEQQAPRAFSPPPAKFSGPTGRRRAVLPTLVTLGAVAVAAVTLWPADAPPSTSPSTSTMTPMTPPTPPTPPVEAPPPPPVEAPPPPLVEAPPIEPPPTAPTPVEAPPPPPPAPPPVEVPPPVPSTKPRSTTSSAKKDAAQALKDIDGAMRTRGLITGDDAELDQLRRAAARARAGRRYEAALKSAEAAIARAAVVRVDRGLVERKLTRFNAAFDREKSAAKRARLDDIAGRASLDFAAGRLDAASRALNEGFALLGKDR